MKSFSEFQEDMSKLPGLGGGGGGTDSIMSKAKGKSLKKRVIDAGKMATVPARFLLNIKSKPDPTEKFADSRMTPKEKVTSAIRNFRKEEVAIANSMSGGGIAGSAEAGDEPPVKKNKRGSGMKNRKKKTYAYGGRGSRKMWMT